MQKQSEPTDNKMTSRIRNQSHWLEKHQTDASILMRQPKTLAAAFLKPMVEIRIAVAEIGQLSGYKAYPDNWPICATAILSSTIGVKNAAANVWCGRISLDASVWCFSKQCYGLGMQEVILLSVGTDYFDIWHYYYSCSLSRYLACPWLPGKPKYLNQQFLYLYYSQAV